MMESGQPGGHDGEAVIENAKPKLKPPPHFKVVMLNDDFTPMEFVVHVLERFFGMDRTQATHVMLQVHTRGKAVCGIYPAQIAETKVTQVNDYARKHQHPLLSSLEEA
ncbi:MAG TPA: ATP-dependent Clp protease adapter ClpS [Gammaproteobacteria bacterium]|nr:ATP-dependent Clp protease adapter ClpS [Gammaproteobacteria bacterium]